MGDSSDEDVIRRQQKSSTHARKRNLEDLFKEQEGPPSEPSEYESESFYDYIDTTSNAILRKIFGTGKEYAYILDQKQKEGDDENICLEENREVFEEKKALDVKEISLFVKSNINILVKDDEIEDFVEMVLNGVCVQFIVLHCPTLNIKIHDAYKIYDLVEYYRQNRSTIEECRRNNSFSLEEFPHFRSARHIVMSFDMDKILSSRAFISASQFKENLQAKERIFEPVDPDMDPECFFEQVGAREADMVRYIGQEIGFCPFFRVEAINWAFENGHVTCTMRKSRNLRHSNEEYAFDEFSMRKER